MGRSILSALWVSFSALRVSTVVLAWLGALAFYATLQGLGRPRPDSLIATFRLLANPVFYPHVFDMTDVPFVSLANIAFFVFTLGILPGTAQGISVTGE